MAVTPMIHRMLKTADPTMVPIPISLDVFPLVNETKEEKSSGADEPAAMKVAPVTKYIMKGQQPSKQSLCACISMML